MNKLNFLAAMGVGVLLGVSTSQAGIIGNPYPASPPRRHGPAF